MRAKLSVSSIAIAFAIISSGSSARAQQSGNSQTIIQADEETRRNSTATIEQDGRENKADGTFRGRESVNLFNGETVDLAPNGAGIYQDGSGSTATIDQFGNGNAAAIDQADSVEGGADSSTAVIKQGESGNEARDSIAYIEQAGDASEATIEQNGRRNQSFGVQRGNLSGSQTGNKQA